MADQPLPTSFWSDPIDGAPVQASETPADQPSEVDSWRPSFALYNTSPEAAMERLYGKPSQHVGGHVMTLEHAFQHLRLEDAAIHRVDPLIAAYDAENPCQHIKGLPCGDCGMQLHPKAVAKHEQQERLSAKAAKAPAVLAARTAWKQAIIDRRVAISQWDAYVQSLHLAFVRARDS